MKLLFILLFGISINSVFANQMVDISLLEQKEIIQELRYSPELESTFVDEPRFKKLKAVLLAVFLGHFGVHRIYLGTSANVPVVYSLTLGGGLGLLPLLDIVAILSTKNIEHFSDNNRVFMWSKKSDS